MTPWLSVAMPVHDGARFLDATLAAAAAEAPDGVEFLLYDSGADDGACRRIAERYAARLDVRYLATPECRAWTAKTNRAVREARAPRVAMLHQDDLWQPGHLAALRAAAAEAPEAVLSIGPSTFISPSGRTVGTWRLPFAPGLHPGADVAATLIVQNTVAVPSPMIRRDAWLAVDGMDEALWYTADWDLYLKLALAGPVHVRRAATTAFRLHGSSLTMTGSRQPDAFRAQLDTVVDRHLPALAPHVRERQARLARIGVAVNCALAARSARAVPQLAGALAALAGLGLKGAGRFLAASRLADRTIPRLRLRLSGEM